MRLGAKRVSSTTAAVSAVALLVQPVALADAGDESADYGYGGAVRTAAVIDLRTPPQRQATRPTPLVVTRALALRQQAEADVSDDVATPVAREEQFQGAAVVTPVALQRGQARPEWLERERVGPPYQADGVWYAPTAQPDYAETGKASWYGAELQGRRTASGELFDQDALTGAHPTLPLPSLVHVTNVTTGRDVIIRVNDRGPFTGGRIIDVSRRAAEVLGFRDAGEAEVHVRYLGPAPRRLEGGTGALRERLGEPPRLKFAETPEAPRTAAGGALFVQVGAFSTETNARRALDAVRSAGQAVIVEQSSGARMLHKVRVGPWDSRAQAETALRAAADLGFGDAVIVAAVR